MKKLFAILICLVTATAASFSAEAKHHHSPRLRLKCPVGCIPTYGPYNSTSDQGTLALTTSSDRSIKEYHGNGPVLKLYMNDGRLPKPYYGQLARANFDWNIVATPGKDVSGKDVGIVTLSLTTQTFWTTVAGDGSWLHRNGYYLVFQRQGTSLFAINLDNFAPGTGGDICGQKSHPLFPRFAIPLDVFVAMDSVLVVANADSMWACS